MAKTYDEVVEIKKSFEDEYRSRHEDFKLLRDYYHGRFWSRAEADSRSVSSVFRDLTAKRSDVGPDIKIVQPIVWEIVTKYQTFLSPVPQCRMYTDPPESMKRRQQATKKERYVYGCWAESRLPKKLAKVGWYLPLMGDCFIGIYPDFDSKVPRMLIRSPEKAYPIPDTEGGLAALIFSDEIRESQAVRQFPNYTPMARRKKNSLVGRFASTLSGTVTAPKTDPLVEVLEYSDEDCFYRWVDTVQVAGIEHKLGFNLFDQVQFINVPDEVWGHGAIEQYIGMNEMNNALMSLAFQGIFENIFPQLVLEDPSKAPEVIDRSGGGVLPLNPGGKAYYIAPSMQGIGMAEQIAGGTDHMIRRGAGMPGVNMGDSPTSSVATGKAINELQGAATGATIEMVQGVGIGQALVNFNMKAVVMGQKLFRDDQINLFGVLPTTHIEIDPKQFALSLKGKELIGSARNEVVFSPHLSDHEKLVMGLQGLGAGLWSKKYIREQQGIPDNEAMVEEIFGEAVEEGTLGAIIQALQADPTEENAATVERRGVGFIEGGAGLSPPTPHPLVAQTGGPGALPAGGPPAGPGGPPPGGPQAGGRLVGPVAPNAPGQALSPPLRLPPGSPQPGAPEGPPPGQSAQGGNTVSVNDVAAAFQNLQGIKGRVFLVGEIAARGQTNGDIEVALTEDDRQAIASGLPQYASRLVFHHVTGEPQEAHVEVTPGQVPSQGGPPPEPATS